MIKHNEFAVSKIGYATFKRYYFSLVYGEVNNIDWKEAHKQIELFNEKQVIEYLTRHPKQTLNIYFKLLKENLLSESVFINFPHQHPYLYSYMKNLNKVYTYAHILLILIFTFLCLHLFYQQDFNLIELIYILFLQIYLIILSSGITCWQGDRIVLPSLTLWIILYCIIFSKLLDIMFHNSRNSSHG